MYIHVHINQKLIKFYNILIRERERRIDGMEIGQLFS